MEAQHIIVFISWFISGNRKHDERIHKICVKKLIPSDKCALLFKKTFHIICLVCQPFTVANGQATYSQSASNGAYLPDTVSTAPCNNGYEKRIGYNTRTCQSNGNWNGWVLQCKKSNLQLHKYLNLPSKCKLFLTKYFSVSNK